MIRLGLPGSIRSKKNSKRAIMVGGKNVPRRPVLLPSKAYQTWEKQARLSAAMQLRGFKATDKPVHVKVTVYYKGKQPDLSGCLESVGDCLEKYLWRDDKQIMSWDGSRLHHDKDNPRTEVEMEIFEGESSPLFEVANAKTNQT